MTTDRNHDHSHAGPTRRTIDPMDTTLIGTPDPDDKDTPLGTTPTRGGTTNGGRYPVTLTWHRPTLTSSTSTGIVVHTRTT